MPDDGGNPFAFPDFSRPRRSRSSPTGAFFDQGKLRQAIIDDVARRNAIIAGAVALPIPIPSPGPVVFPSPGTAAANDAVFGRATGQVLGRAVGGGIGAIIVITGIAIAKRVAELKKARKEAETEAEKIGIDRQNARIARDKVIKTLPKPDNVAIIVGGFPGARPDFPTAPTVRVSQRPGNVPSGFPELPGQFEIPEPVLLPEPVIVPAPAGLPAPAPVAAPQPIPGFGVPETFPGGFPSSSPFPPPGIFPTSFPSARPVAFPVGLPVGDVFPPPAPLGFAGPSPFPSGFPGQDPQPQTQTNPDKKCREVKRRRRRKDECEEGFYKEKVGSTQFTGWRTVNCVTRKETRRSKLENSGFDVTNVENF